MVRDIRVLLPIITVLLVSGWSAPVGAASASAIPVTSVHDGLIIDSIVIDNRNIYDTDDDKYDTFVFRLANRLHLKTRVAVVRRELLLEVGDSYSQELADESSRNLRHRLALFDAWVEAFALPNGHVMVRVVTIDRWSFSGGLQVNRDGNETTYKIGVEESNLLGYNQYLSFYFHSQPHDRDFVETSFTEYRLMGRPFQLNVDYTNNPLGEVASLKLSRPFYTLSQSTSFGMRVSEFEGRRDIYQDTYKIAESYFTGDYVKLDAAYRIGSYRRKLLFETSYVYNYERSTDREILSPLPVDSALAIASFPQDSLYHRLGLGIGLSDYDYIKLHRIDGFGFTEDFVLGNFVEVGFARAFEPGFDDHLYDEAFFQLSRFSGFGRSLLFLNYRQVFYYRGQDDVRRTGSFLGQLYYHPVRFFTFAAQISYTANWYSEGADNLYLGGATGIRGYDKYFKTGNRRAVANLEGRFFSDIEILSVLFGGVLFVDMGNIWKADEPVRIRDFYTAVGTGLRIAFEKSSKNIVRIDLAYSAQNQWQLSVGTSQYFYAQP